MKLFLLVCLSVFMMACNNDAEINKQATTTGINPEAAMKQVREAEAKNGIAPENDMCICTKEWMPVCGKNGRTYPSKCQAGCDKVEVVSEGPCPK